MNYFQKDYLEKFSKKYLKASSQCFLEKFLHRYPLEIPEWNFKTKFLKKSENVIFWGNRWMTSWNNPWNFFLKCPWKAFYENPWLYFKGNFWRKSRRTLWRSFSKKHMTLLFWNNPCKIYIKNFWRNVQRNPWKILEWSSWENVWRNVLKVVQGITRLLLTNSFW